MERDRVERLLALLLLQSHKSSPMSEKLLALNIAGFSNIEIAEILQIQPAAIAQRIYDARRVRKLKRPPRTQKKTK